MCISITAKCHDPKPQVLLKCCSPMISHRITMNIMCVCYLVIIMVAWPTPKTILLYRTMNQGITCQGSFAHTMRSPALWRLSVLIRLPRDLPRSLYNIYVNTYLSRRQPCTMRHSIFSH